MSKKVLIIEDEEVLVDMYKVELERLGFNVKYALDGEDGLKAAKEERPDLIILDLLLPGMSGMKVLRTLKDDPETKDIPVFIFTNYEAPEEREKGQRLGAEKYVLKTSITPREVGELIKERLEKNNY
ncbi:MAG: response regulator [Minisyncoccales bacterium]|jgi:CheY-like chemotaxis protein